MADFPEATNRKTRTRGERHEQSAEDQETLKEKLKKLQPNMRAFAMSLCGDLEVAKEMVSETNLKVQGSMDQFAIGTNFRAWVFTILRNTYFSYLRRKKREVAGEEGENILQNAIVPGNQEHAADLNDFRKKLQELPDDQREALLLIGAGFSYKEASSTAGAEIGTIKSRVSRARSKLRELLGELPGDEELLDSGQFSWEPLVLSAAGFPTIDISRALKTSVQAVERGIFDGRAKLAKERAKIRPHVVDDKSHPETTIPLPKLIELISKMPPELGEVLRLPFVERLSFSQSAEKLKITRPKFLEQLDWARDRLREMLRE